MTTLFLCSVFYYIDTLVPLDLIHHSRSLSIFTQQFAASKDQIIATFSLLILLLQRHANDEI